MTAVELLDNRFVWALGGAVVTLAAAYFAFSRDVSKDISYIKGQNNILIQKLNIIDKMQERLIIMDRDIERAKYDLNSTWKEIRVLKGGSNGSRA